MPIATQLLLACALALPWVVLPMLVVRRHRATRSLDEYDAAVMLPAERVSLVLPARNEALHIAECIASLRATTWPNVEIIVVDDGSTDGTGAIARAAVADDDRLRVVDAPALPPGWFGKQWACHTGVLETTGSLLMFTDADTRHGPDLIARLVQARVARNADLMSVIGSQEMKSFWEQAIQPAVFSLLLARYGGTNEMEGARRAVDVIANGQCMLFTRTAYGQVGGHAAVRDTVAEDLMLAQRTHQHGLRVSLVRGTRQLTTHMYDGLGAIVRGWMKNVYAGGRKAMWGGRVGELLFPFALVGGPLGMVAPFIVAFGVVAFALAGHPVPFALGLWSIVSAAGMLWYFAAVNAIAEGARWRVLLVPVGLVAFAAICVAAVVRGRNVEWKGRAYRAS